MISHICEIVYLTCQPNTYNNEREALCNIIIFRIYLSFIYDMYDLFQIVRYHTQVFDNIL